MDAGPYLQGVSRRSMVCFSYSPTVQFVQKIGISVYPPRNGVNKKVNISP